MTVNKDIEHALEVVAKAALSIEPLLGVLQDDIRIYLDDKSLLEDPRKALGIYFEFTKITNQFNRIQLTKQRPEDISSFELAISNYVNWFFQSMPKNVFSELDYRSFRRLLQNKLKSIDGTIEKREIRGRKNHKLNVYLAGEEANPAVVLITACGMPVELSRPWLDFLSKKYFVVTWETRGLFDDTDINTSIDPSVDAQVDDLIDIIDEFNLSNIHLMGFCGGAVIALHACNQYRHYFSSVSLWHGDFNFSDDCVKTEHQRNVETLMDLGGENLDKASSYRMLMERPFALNTLPVEAAHLVLYPYASDKIFYNYCRLNGEIMRHDSAKSVNGVQLPALIVTSRDDYTAHPEGSRMLAAMLKGATFIEEPSGNHIALFSASENLTRIAEDFIDNHLF